jgi:hypothetical protein
MKTLRNERGIALIFTMILAFAVAALALGAIIIGSNATLVSRFHVTEAGLQAAADGGLEIARDSLNRVPALLPDSGFVTLLANQPVRDASGTVISGYTRSVYVGRSGGRAGGVGSAGQYGNNLASAVSVIRNVRGAVAARRLLLTQDSWSKFAIAVNDWTNGGIMYGCDEQVQGPFHSNNGLVLQGGCSNPKTLFTGPVTIVNSSVTNQASGNWTAGLQTSAAPIAWVTPADLNRLRSYAQDADAVNGDYDITADPNLTSKQPNTRLDFVTVDVNHNGTIEWDEGFVRVFKSYDNADTSLAYVTARQWPKRVQDGPGTSNASRTDQDVNQVSRNCGAMLNGWFITADSMMRANGPVGAGAANAFQRDSVRLLYTSPSRRCYLGGDPHLFTAATSVATHGTMGGLYPVADTLTPDSVVTRPRTNGRWIQRRTGAVPAVLAVRPGDAVYLIPLGRNANFKGIIYVTGSVAISGKLRGRVTVAATGNIMLADDLLYQTSPGTNCTETGDILGTFSQQSVLIQDNNVQTPFRVNNGMVGLFDDTPDAANFNMFILTLQDWAGDNPGWPSGVSPSEAGIVGQTCGGAPRGCVRVTGGITEGFVRQVTYSAQAGWAERHTYDVCGAISPPPYWPTTGRYSKNRYYELDPVWLNQVTIATLFQTLQSQ